MEELETTIVAVGEYVPVEQSETWFNTVCDVYDECEEDWDSFRTSLIERAAQASFSSDVAETFVRVMEDQISDRWTVLRTMSEQRDYLPAQYAELLAQLASEADGTGADEVVPWDADTAVQWYGYLVGDTGGWSGQEADWESFRSSFLQSAEPDGALPQATRFLDEIEADSGGKVAALAELGINIAEREAAEDKGYDEATGLYYDESGARYRRDDAGVDHPLQWTDSNLYWVNVDGADHWYDESFQPYGVPAEAEAEAEAEAGSEVEPAQAVENIQSDVFAALLADHAEFVEQLGSPEVFEQLVAEVLRERVAAMR